MKRMTTFSLVGCLGLLFAASTCFAQKYTVTDLGTLGGNVETAAYGINASGQVVGVAFTTGNTATHAFLYSGGVMSCMKGEAFHV